MKAVERLLRKALGEGLHNNETDGADGSHGPVLGDDILDLSPFGGWEEALTYIMSSRQEAKAAVKIISGTQPSSGSPDITWAVQRTLAKEPRLLVAIVATLSAQQRQNLTNAYLFNRLDLETLLTRSPDYAHSNGLANLAPKHGRLSVTDIERAAPSLGWPDTALFDVAFTPGNSWSRQMVSRSLASIDGFDEFVAAHAATVREILAPPAKKDHKWMWERLSHTSTETQELFLPELAHALAANAKSIRDVAAKLVTDLSTDRVIAELQSVAEDGTAAQSARAIDALGRLTSDATKPALMEWARSTFASSRSAAVTEAVERLDRVTNQPPVDLPVLPILDPSRMVELGSLPSLSRRRGVDELVRVANGERGQRPHGSAAWMLGGLLEEHPKSLTAFNEIHIARVLLSTHSVKYVGRQRLQSFWKLGNPSPLTLSAVAQHDGGEPRPVLLVVGGILEIEPDHWSDDELTDWVAYNADAIIDYLSNREAYTPRNGVFTALARASNRPPHLDEALVAAAVNGFKADRERLYEIVDASQLDLVMPYLTSRTKADRKGAAEWLRVHPAEVAAKPLLAAARKEKDDGVKAAMLSALEVGGLDIDEFVSPEALAADAAKAMKRKGAIPKSISWLDFGHLPPLSWSDGSPVNADVVKMFLTNAVKAKTAEPSPILRRHFDNMEPDQVRVFGRSLLDLWLTEDLRTYHPDEARAEAQRQAPHHYNWSQRGHGNYAGMTQAQIEEALYGDLLTTLAGSATTSKGLLAVVAASAGGEVADKVLAYIRRHRGQRVSQAKIMLQMLAWIDEPATIQAVMAIASRFRPKGIQDEATKQAELLAERHGWTIDDLADRSVPDGGFDDEGRTVYDYGTRTFTAHLNDDLSLTLNNDETGKTVRSLPKGRADEDDDLIKGLKQELTAAKKDLKSTAKIQPERLYQAMCAQRAWSADDFERYLVHHPVMVRLATRLVWRRSSGPSGDDPAGTSLFRPLTDGTLLDADDEDATLAPDDRITIAHEQLMSREQAQAWQQHLIDYEISSLFPQFGRPVFTPTEGQTEIDDVYGHVLTDNAMRSQMNRLAWQLGAPQDAGIAWEILKPVPAADITAVLSLQENGLSAARYDGDLEVMLASLFFVEGKNPHDPSAAVELAEVPPVLLSEIYDEVTTIAAAGSGFNPKYARKRRKR